MIVICFSKFFLYYYSVRERSGGRYMCCDNIINIHPSVLLSPTPCPFHSSLGGNYMPRRELGSLEQKFKEKETIYGIIVLLFFIPKLRL